MLAVALLVTAAGCTTDQGPTGTEPPAPAQPDPALLALGELLDADGALPVAQAQRMVAALVEPLPGIEPWTVDGPAPTELAGLAVRTVAAALPTLDAAVADKIKAIIEPAEGEEEAVLRPGQPLSRSGAATAGSGRVPPTEELTALVAEVVAGIEERSGHRLRVPIRIRTVPNGRTGGDAVMVPVTGPDGRTRACRILLPHGLFGDDAASINSTVAHEVWHCFQYDAVPANRLDGAPLWIIEGQAEWAGEAYVGGSPASAHRWDTWLLQPATALTRRSYDAIGLYAVADAAGADPWRTALPMLRHRGNRAVETLFERSATEAVRRVATSLVRSPELGEIWESRGPGITGARVAPLLTVSAGEPVEARMRVSAFGSLPVRIAAGDGEVLRIEVQGGAAAAVAMPGAGTVELSPGGSAMFCLVEGGCGCDDASRPGDLPSATAGEGAAAIGAVTAGEVAVVATMLTVAESCEPGDLVGEWVTEVSKVMGMMAKHYGPMPSCTGPWAVTFTAEGRFSAGFDATCRVESVTGEARARFTGRYVDHGRSFTVSDVKGEGTMKLNGTTVDWPGVDGFRTALGTTSDYVIDGDTLTYSFATPDGKKPTIVLTRRA